MAQPPMLPQMPGDGSRQPAVTASRAVFALIGAAALVLGYVGMDQYLTRIDFPSRGVLDLLYATLQLFVLGSDPLQDSVDLPPALQVARFAAPVVTLYALAEASRLLLASKLRRMRARRARNHVVVCGDTSVARNLATRLHRSGRRVVVIRNQPIGPLELSRRTLLGINGDARDADVLRGAGVERATVVYACAEGSATNLAIAAAAARLVERRDGDVAVYVQIHEADWALTLQARRLGVSGASGPRVEFFHLDQLAVHVLMGQQPLPGGPEQVPRLLVAGDAPLAGALLVGAARQWRLVRHDPEHRAEVVYVAPDATRVLERLARQYPALRDGCHVVPYENGLAAALAGIGAESPFDRAFLCFTDEKEGLQIALNEYRLWHRVRGDIVVTVGEFAAFADAFSLKQAPPLLDPLDGRLRLFSPASEGCDPELIAEDLSERLARLIHERYLVGCLERGVRMGDHPAMVAWSDLDEPRRRSNRLQAADLGAKLHLINCAIVPRTGDEPFEFADGEVELLARRESHRWSNESAPVPGRSRYQVEWEALPSDGRAKCIAAIHDIPKILGEAGFQMVRLSDNRTRRAYSPV